MQAMSLLPYVLLQLPVILPLLVGLVIAVITWKKHSQVSLLALIGLSFLFVNVILGLGSLLSPAFMLQMGIPITSYSILTGVLGVVRSLVEIIGLSLVVTAIFIGRKTPQPAPVVSSPQPPVE